MLTPKSIKTIDQTLKKSTLISDKKNQKKIPLREGLKKVENSTLGPDPP